MANTGPPDDVSDDVIGVYPADLRVMTIPVNNKPGPNFTGPPPIPDPLYFELKNEIEGMCLVAETWFEHIGNHIYTRQMRDDIEEFLFKMEMFLTSLEYPVPASEIPPLDEFGDVPTTKVDYWEYLKDEYDVLNTMTDNMRTAPKRVHRTPSGDEAAVLGVLGARLDHSRRRLMSRMSSQTTGSTSQTAPTSAPPSTEPIAEDTDHEHHAQPSTPTRE